MPPRRVILRPDAGSQSGLGHVQRCLALAAALVERGVECGFLVPDAESVRTRIEAAGFEVRGLEHPEAPGEVIAAAAGTVVVDSYGLDEAYLRRLGEAGLAVVAVDDHAARPIHARLCVNGGAHAESLRYRSASGDTRFLLGPRFAMLRPELWDVAAREPAATVTEVLVALGGGDPHGLAATLLRALDAVGADFALTLVVGPYFTGRDALADAARACRRTVTLLDAPTSPVPSMRRADLAVSAAGQTLYELVRLAVPTIAVGIAENQRGSLDSLAAAGVVKAAGWAGEVGLATAVAGAVAGLIDDAMARSSLALAAGSLLDGQGARRTAEAICEL